MYKINIGLQLMLRKNHNYYGWRRSALTEWFSSYSGSLLKTGTRNRDGAEWLTQVA